MAVTPARPEVARYCERIHWVRDMKIRIVAALFALAALGCNRDDRSSGGPSSATRDSAGIRVIENPRPAEGSRLAWRIGPGPVVSIGTRRGEGPYMLHQVWDALKLRDGRIVVANSGTNELRVFDPSGTWLETWAGQGEGPGEFFELAYIDHWPGDSIAAWWGPRRGISVFDSEGNFGRTFALERNRDDPMALHVNPIAVRSDGSILVGHDPFSLDPVLVEVRGAEGQLLSSLGEHPGRGEQSIFGASMPREPWGDLIVISPADRYEIRAFSVDGTLARIVRWGQVPRSPTREDVDAYIEERVSWYPPDLTPAEIAEYRTQKRKEWRSEPVAEHFPAFSSVIADKLAHLWVEEYESVADDYPARLWTVFDPEGGVLGYFETPKDWRIFEIGEDYILVLVRGELDVETVQVWPLERS